MQLSCKMCGGNLIAIDNGSVCECEYCGSRQTIPKVDDERKVTLYSRANRLRINNEFDKAAGVYENLIVDFPDEAEAYWGLVLCKYGIEYVDDPRTAKKIPTCHRSSYTSVFDDPDYKTVIAKADAASSEVYRNEASVIEGIRRGIIEISNNEPPYDVFICYKETAQDGGRTIDSVMAQDVYEALTEKGYRVFYSRITLEDKLGVEYEPYIFAALNSAKVMLVFGTSFENFDSVWVKNEWSRFLRITADNKNRHIIPCFKDIDPYDMPKEFSRLQAQDMGKVGALQDLVRGVEKLLGKTNTANYGSGGEQASCDSILIRAQQLIELENYEDAKRAYDRASQDYPKDYRGWWGLIICELYSPQKKTVDTAKTKEWFRYALKVAPQEEVPNLKAQMAQYMTYNRWKFANLYLDNVQENQYYRDLRKKIDTIDQNNNTINASGNPIRQNLQSVQSRVSFLQNNVDTWEREENARQSRKKKLRVAILILLAAILGSFVYMTNTASSGSVALVFILISALVICIYFSLRPNLHADDLLVASQELYKARKMLDEYNTELKRIGQECALNNLNKNKCQQALSAIDDFAAKNRMETGTYFVLRVAPEYEIGVDLTCDPDIEAKGDYVMNILTNGAQAV